MSSWTTLNLVVDDADEMVQELEELEEDRDLRLSIYQPSDDSYTQGIDVVVYRFKHGDKVLKEFVSGASQPIKTMVVVSCSDTTDHATITLTSTETGLKEESWSGEISVYKKSVPELHPWESYGAYGEYDRSTDLIEELREKHGIVPDIGGNFHTGSDLYQDEGGGVGDDND